MRNPFRMIDERVTVVLPVGIDFVVTSTLKVVDWIVGVPFSHISFHPRSHVPLVITRARTACPSLPVSHR